jgi:nitrogen regulatory protein PII
MKYALFLVLNDVDKLRDVHRVLYDLECGATTMNSEGMGKLLLENNVDVPVFSGIRKLIEGEKPYNKTIISVIHSEEKMRQAVDAIKEELQMDTVNKRGVGYIFVLPVIECHGYKASED